MIKSQSSIAHSQTNSMLKSTEMGLLITESAAIRIGFSPGRGVLLFPHEAQDRTSIPLYESKGRFRPSTFHIPDPNAPWTDGMVRCTEPLSNKATPATPQPTRPNPQDASADLCYLAYPPIKWSMWWRRTVPKTDATTSNLIWLE
jgi:hypothetical protein